MNTVEVETCLGEVFELFPEELVLLEFVVVVTAVVVAVHGGWWLVRRWLVEWRLGVSGWAGCWSVKGVVGMWGG